MIIVINSAYMQIVNVRG